MFLWKKSEKRYGDLDLPITLPDTNYILRYLLKDHAAHFEISQNYWSAVREGKTRAIITEGVLMEAIYVLTKFYKVPKKDAAQALTDILHYPGIDSPNLQAFLRALKLFSEKSLDFVDCLLASHSKKDGAIVQTFDERLKAVF